MTPEQFLGQLKRQGAPAACLFIGPEAYQRSICRKALLDRMLPAEERENGLTRADLDEVSLSELLDDARSLSLFATARLIWVAGAEAALPRVRGSAAAGGDDSESKATAAEALAGYLKNPTPGTVIVFDATRVGFDRDDKSKFDRILKFYAPVPLQVEFRPYDHRQASVLALNLARQAGLDADTAALELLVESLDSDAARIAVELEKLRLFRAAGQKITVDDILNLVPDARASNIFALVEALGRRDRAAALDILDSLVKEGEYLPLALSFLDTQFRYALMAKEAGLRDAAQIQNHFSRPGVMMFRSRAEQIAQSASKFTKEQIETAIGRVFQADQALRDARPDDRLVMESFIFSLTGTGGV